MTDQTDETVIQSGTNKIWRVIRGILFVLLTMLIILLVTLGLLANSDKGSRWLLETVMNQQKMIHYQYEQGNLVRGLILKDIVVKVKKVDVLVSRADVRLGWRAIVDKEIHLMTAKVGTVQVIHHAAPSHEPFKLPAVKLPFVLRLDDAKLDKLVIQTAQTTLNFYHIQLHDAVWQDYKIQLKDSAVAMDFLTAKNITGHIELNQHYPLDVRANVTIPALNSINLPQLEVIAKGDLDTLKAGAATVTPDIISAYAVVHPIRSAVPMLGKVYWKALHVPIVPEQKLYSDAGQIDVSGDLHQLNFAVLTDLSGQYLPKGMYQADLNTDLKQLNIEKLTAQLMQGQVDLKGYLNWQQGIHWDITGRTQGINPKHEQIPAMLQDFLPANMSGKIASKGHIEGTQPNDIQATVDFDHAERWQLQLKQLVAKSQQAEPWQVNVAWHGINRALPYIGWLNSQQGNVGLVLAKQGQEIQLATDIRQHAQSSLPAGYYAAQLKIANQILTVKDFRLTQGNSALSGRVVVQLPTDKTALKWDGQIMAKHFNPQTLVKAAPVNDLDGQLLLQGYQQQEKYILKLKDIQLTGRIPQAQGVHTVSLTGQSTLAALMHTGRQKGLKSFAVKYDGALNAQNYTQGVLRVALSGTPQFLNIAELYHQGAAGQINAKGRVNLVQGIAWDVQANVQQFKPQYFISSVQGDITGRVKSTGQWSEQHKNIRIQDLNLRGQLNQKALLGQGNLALNFTQAHGFVPQQFEANQLVLSYANNVLQANGNAQRLQINVNAANLSELYPELRGTMKGVIALQTQPQLHATSNLVMQNFAYDDLFSIDKASLIGTLPTAQQPSQMVLQVQNLKNAERRIDSAKLELIGTRQAHVLKIQGQNKLSKFYAQLAGGFNQQNDWLGQLQQGSFDSNRVRLQQSQPSAMIYRHANAQLSLMQHCWHNHYFAQSQICLDQPLLVSKAQGAISATVKNMELGDFAAYMPTGLALSGKLNGYSRVSWQHGQPIQMDTQLITRTGNIGLTTDEMLEQPMASLAYNEIRLDAKTLPQGLSLRLNADTPLLGTGLMNVLIGTQDKDKSISGDIILEKVKLNLFKPFVSDVRMLDGQLSAAGKLSGTLKQPLFNGEIHLKDGKIAMISVPLQLENIQLASSIRGNTATINGGFSAGRGAGRITGNIDWQKTPHIQLKVSGQELLVAQPPMVSAAVSPDINIDIRPMQKQLMVNGQVAIPRAVISMPESNQSVMTTSSDVRIVETGKEQLALLKAAKPWNIHADIAVILGQSVVFRGFNSTIPLVGRLNLSQRGAVMAMQANGAIGVSRQVKIEAYGQSLDLNRAIGRFAGELANPVVDIDATKNVQNSTIGVAVTGVANRPTVRIYNDAGLTEQEALNALLTGRISTGAGGGVNNTEGFKSDVNNTIAAAGLSLGLGGTRALTNQIGRSFGLSGLALDAQGSGDDTQVSVTGYITPDLYLRYGVGIFTPVNKLTLRYQANRRLYVEASSSLERAVDLFYNWRF